MKGKPYYDHFFCWQAAFPFDCPLCGTHVPAGVKHECSNPEPLYPPPNALPPRRGRRPTVGAEQPHYMSDSSIDFEAPRIDTMAQTATQSPKAPPDELQHGVRDVLYDNLGEGWRASCLCGWESGLNRCVADAGEEFDEHLADELQTAAGAPA